MSSGDSLIVITANIKQKIENSKNNNKKDIRKSKYDHLKSYVTGLKGC
jgi:hypothetical protein